MPLSADADAVKAWCHDSGETWPACLQVGPELEIPGYGCEDHFQEMDTVEHSWECLTELLTGKRTSLLAELFSCHPPSASQKLAGLCSVASQRHCTLSLVELKVPAQ